MQSLIKLMSVALFISSLSVYARVDHYYYYNSRIQLQQRADKIAVILESFPYSRPMIINHIKSRINNSDTIKSLTEGVLLITIPSNRSVSDLSSIEQNLSSVEGIKFVTPVYYGESRRVTQVPTDEFIVKLRRSEDLRLLERSLVMNNCYIKGNVGSSLGFIVKSFGGVKLNALELADIFYNTAIFEFAEPDFIYPEFCLLNLTPNDPFYSSQWALNNTGQTVLTEGYTPAGDAASVNGIPGADMNLSKAWDHTTGSSSVKVGVLDTGIDSTHPDFQSPGHLMEGYDAFYNMRQVPRDSGSHGTCTAGLIGAVLNNSTGVSGIAPGCRIMSIRIFNAFGSATTIGIARGFDTARVRGIDILSNSWGGGTPTAAITGAINSAALNGRGGLGCIILFSSGNEGRNPPAYPSYLSNVICVGATTPHDQKKAPGSGNQFWWGGNYGESVSTGDIDCSAPTVCYSTDVQGSGGYNTSAGAAGNYYATFNGTSCSCPNAAGVAALVLSVNTSQTRLQVTENLLRGCTKIDNVSYSSSKIYGKWNIFHGYGRINAYNSVRLAAGIDITPPSIVHTNAASHNSTYPTVITAVITDQDGSSVPVTGNLQPKIIFRTNKNNGGWSAFDSANAVSNSGGVFTFNIPCLGWETEVQYFIKAYDNNGNTSVFPHGAPNVFWLCYYAVGSLTESTGKISAWRPPDAGVGISGNVNFTNFKILNAKARIYLRHTWVSDNILQIWSPSSDNSNNRKCLFSLNGGNGDDITGAAVSDSGSSYWHMVNPPYTNGNFQPEITMRGYLGTIAGGNWRFINYDVAFQDAPTYDSIRITLLRTAAILSPAARLNTEQDSVLDFGIIPQDSFVDKNFYLKNSGNSNLSISGTSFTGTFASYFTLISSLPGNIFPGDSGLFTVRANNIFGLRSDGNNSLPDAPENAVLNINNNDPSKPVFKVSLQSDYALPVTLASFNASVSGRNVLLSWVTLEELNNAGFEVQRQDISLNRGRTGWTVLGFINGRGTTNEPVSYSYSDLGLIKGLYRYRLKQIDYNSGFEYIQYHSQVEIGSPASFDLSQNYPNPSNPLSKIDYQLPVEGYVKIEVYDMSGRLVRLLVNSKMDAGYYSTEFDGSNIASGIYIYRITVLTSGASFTDTKKLVLIK